MEKGMEKINARIEEIREKTQRIRKFLQDRGLRALLLKRHANFSWMTGGGLNLVGFATEMGMTSLLITDREMVVIANNIEAPRMRAEERVEELGFILRTFPWYENQEAQIVREWSGEGPVGCDLPFPGTILVADEVSRLRFSLTSSEIERYRWLGEKASRALEKTLRETQRGEKECEVVGRLCREIWAERIDPVLIGAAADERMKHFRHPIPTEKRLERSLMVTLNARKWGLIVCLTRFIHFGKLPSDLRTQYEANLWIDCTLMAHTQPGVRVREILERALEAYRLKGYPEEWKLHHQGGAIGYLPREYRADFETQEVVQENQAFCWNPSIAGTKSEDTILASSKGLEMITRPVLYPRISLEVNGIHFHRPDILEK